MTTDELRAKFEAWYSQDFYAGTVPAPTWIEERNCYQMFTDHLAWNAYQAAHASRDDEVEAQRKDAEIGRYVLKYSEWIRDHGDTFMAIRFPSHVNLSSIGARRDAIDDAMREESK